MKTTSLTCVLRRASVALAAALWVSPAIAHPGWGIEVMKNGDVIFADVGNVTIWRLRPDGALSPWAENFWTHNIDLHSDGALTFGREEYRGDVGPYHSFYKRDPNGEQSVLIAPHLDRASSLSANAVADGAGNVYYFARGGLVKRSSDGAVTPFADLKPHGMATLKMGPDERLYCSDGQAIHAITLQGEVSVAASQFVDETPDDPFFKSGGFNSALGFDIADTGEIYVAYFGNRRLLKISRDGKRSELYHAAAPWSPAGVAAHGTDLYILEIAFTSEKGHFGPRIRKRNASGDLRTLAEVGQAAEAD